MRIAQDSCPSPACPNLGPGQGWTFFQNGNPALPIGYQGSALVESDQPIVALQAKDVLRNGAFMIEILSNIADDTVIFRFSDPARPAISSPFEQKEGEDLVIIQMPMQVL